MKPWKIRLRLMVGMVTKISRSKENAYLIKDNDFDAEVKITRNQIQIIPIKKGGS